YRQWRCALHGGPTCPPGESRSGSPSDTAITQDAKKAYDASTVTITSLRAQLAMLLARKTHLQSQFDSAQNNSHGLIINIEALTQITGTNTVLQTILGLLFLLFTTIGSLPTIAKILHNLGPPNTYEKNLRTQELTELRSASEHLRNLTDPNTRQP